jgi:hypothetical protein
LKVPPWPSLNAVHTSPFWQSLSLLHVGEQ